MTQARNCKLQPVETDGLPDGHSAVPKTRGKADLIDEMRRNSKRAMEDMIETAVSIMARKVKNQALNLGYFSRLANGRVLEQAREPHTHLPAVLSPLPKIG